MTNGNMDRNVEAIISQRRLLAAQPRDVIFTAVIGGLLIVFLSKALESHFIGNLQILAILMAPIGIVAVGQTLVVITGGVDLSVGSVAALTGIVIARLTTHRLGEVELLNPWVAVVLALALATGIGWLHGVLISRYKLAPFIVTFGSLSLFRGLAQVISNGSPVNPNTDAFGWLWENAFGIIPVPVILMLIVFVVLAYLLRNSRFGRYAYAIGSNETVARLSGINVDHTRQIVYATSGFLAGLVGFLLMARIEAGAYSNGQGYELQSIAAVIIGGTSLKGGSGGVWGTLGGVLVLSIVNSGLILFSAPPLWNEVIIGAIIVGAALIDVQRRRFQESTLTPVAAPLVTMIPVNNLNQALNRFVQAVQDRFQCDAVRVYLLDRDSGKLVEPISHAAPKSTLTTRVSTIGKPLTVSDVRRDGHSQVIPVEPAIRAAAALPIMCQERMIGVVELQSTVVDAFGGAAIESTMTLTAQMAGPLEDNWLLEGGWLTRQVRDCLRNLGDDVYLDKCALGDWLLTPTVANRAESLRQMLHDAIEHLRPIQGDPQSRALRRYQILRQIYTDQRNVDAIIRDLGLSRRQYFYDLKEAVDAVTHHLVTQRRYRR